MTTDRNVSELIADEVHAKTIEKVTNLQLLLLTAHETRTNKGALTQVESHEILNSMLNFMDEIEIKYLKRITCSSRERILTKSKKNWKVQNKNSNFTKRSSKTARFN